MAEHNDVLFPPSKGFELSENSYEVGFKRSTMAATSRQVVSCMICIVACLISLGCFIAGVVLRYMEIEPPLAVVLIGLGADIASLVNFLKNIADYVDTSTVTQEFYYNAGLYTCLLITGGEFGVGIWYMVAGLSELAMTLITQAVVMTTLSVYLKRTNITVSTTVVPTTTTTVLPTTAAPKLVMVEKE